MYKCAVTKKISKPGQQAHKIVTEKREKKYYGPRGELLATGWEIVKELMVCKEVHDKFVKEGTL